MPAAPSLPGAAIPQPRRNTGAPDRGAPVAMHG